MTTFKCILLRNLAVLFILAPFVSGAQQAIFSSPAFGIFNDRVVQGKYEAKAISSTYITSNYESPANGFQSADITFKFAINGKDNEMLPGQDHHFTVDPVHGSATTPLIVFGKQLNQLAPKKIYLKPDTRLKIRLDFREVLRQFKQQGYVTCYNGTKIFKEDFKGVYVAGGTLPMVWDFDNLQHHDQLQLKDDDGDGIYETDLVLNSKSDQKQIATEWKQSKDITAFPAYHSDWLLSNALYNMSVEEMLKAVEPDSTFRTGKEWAGVWTRDISYSIILSMAYLQPQVAKNSLLKKVNLRKRIIQDTGTGGAYPASTDRMIWATAAWEVYKATGDQDWLKQAFEIVRNSINDDLQNVYDAQTGLVKGESSFLDWREQTYPKWMQPADIFESECLGTNAVHYQANRVLSEMAKVLQDTAIAQQHLAIAQKIRSGINNYLWLPQKGYYGQYLYGRNHKMISSRSEALGEALCVLFGIADENRSRQIIASVPVTDYGISCIYPQIPDIAPYHNNAVWPFVQAYWALAAAKAGNQQSVLESISDIYRASALFLTNKENFVADNGDFAGTQINSSNMLWSLSGSIAMIHKVIFGIRFEPDQLNFHPFVPAGCSGIHQLLHFNYRNALLNIELKGTGNRVRYFYLDGKLQADPFVPSTLSGVHQINIELNQTPLSPARIHKVKNHTSPATPQVSLEKGQLAWEKEDASLHYEIMKDGHEIRRIRSTSFPLPVKDFGEYQVVALDQENSASFASEPISVYDSSRIIRVEAEKNTAPSELSYPGFSGNGFVETSKTIHPTLEFPVQIATDGNYAIDFKYANGNGQVNTENKCAIRTLYVNNQLVGTIILPQRGTKEWSNWGFSNALSIPMKAGSSVLRLVLEDHDENMNGPINQAMIDLVRLVRIN